MVHVTGGGRHADFASQPPPLSYNALGKGGLPGDSTRPVAAWDQLRRHCHHLGAGLGRAPPWRAVLALPGSLGTQSAWAPAQAGVPRHSAQTMPRLPPLRGERATPPPACLKHSMHGGRQPTRCGVQLGCGAPARSYPPFTTAPLLASCRAGSPARTAVCGSGTIKAHGA